MTEMFRSSLFGYEKKSVCAYIAQMNEEVSQKLLEKDLEYKKTVQELREQLEQLKAENEQLRAGREEVAGALIDAKSFATDLKEQATKESRALRAKNEAYHTVELQRLKTLARDIDTLHNAFRSLLAGMDEEVERYRVKCQAMQVNFEQKYLAADAVEEEKESAESA